MCRACPHHNCATCGRTTAAAGGLLFRCEMCDTAYCEDHLPDGARAHACSRQQHAARSMQTGSTARELCARGLAATRGADAGGGGGGGVVAADYDIVGECQHFLALGQAHPKQACFVVCSSACK